MGGDFFLFYGIIIACLQMQLEFCEDEESVLDVGCCLRF